MKDSTEDISAKKAIALLAITYFISYVTRNSYSVVIAEMVQQTRLTQSELSLAVTGSLVTYGAGQIISGYFGDRFQPKSLVFWGLVITSLMNLAIPLCQMPLQMLSVWCINGLAQAFLWPPIVRLMAHLFCEETYQRATVAVTWGGSFGNIMLYLISPALISLWGWRSVFWISAVCGMGMAVIWRRRCPPIPAQQRPAHTERFQNPFLLLLVWCVMLAIVLQGALRDGVTTWMPVYLAQTYDLESTVSILMGVVLPVFSLVCIQGTALLHRRVLPNPLACAGTLFGAGALAALMLALLSDCYAALSVVLSALLTGCMHGVNLLLICILPAHFQRYGKVSLLSGVLNACTYVGSAVSTYGIAAISERSGWKAAIAVWPVVALAGAIVCGLCISAWKRFQQK